MVDHIANRNALIDYLHGELVGPFPVGKEIDCEEAIVFETPEDSFGPWVQAGSKEEILLRDTPTKRYGIGVLYVPEIQEETDAPGDIADDESEQSDDDQDIDSSGGDEDPLAEIEGRIQESRSVRAIGQDSDTQDFDLSNVNKFKPSSAAISFLADLSGDSELVVEVTGGRYKEKKISVAGMERIWWLRSPISLNATFKKSSLCTPKAQKATPDDLVKENLEGLDIRVEVYSRPRREDPTLRLLTVCLVNRSKNEDVNKTSLFQTHFKAYVRSAEDTSRILPYPQPPHTVVNDLEEQSINLLYRSMETYAIGHGCAAEWDSVATNGTVAWASMESLPRVETPSITPDIRRGDGSLVGVSMVSLAGLVPRDDGYSSLREVIDLYEAWVIEKEQELTTLDSHYQEAGRSHLAQCRRCLERMHDGLDLLQTDPDVKRAFQLANYAVLLQQIQSRQEARTAKIDPKTRRLEFAQPYTEPDVTRPPQGRGVWRPFQITFLLMSLRSTARGDCEERKAVELIWFPTGGGKTEAYLGLAAFSMFLRRLETPEEHGLDVLMRYTLRLLTTQQFSRASGLICAMEYIRAREPDLGDQSFSIGIWLGGSTTPNNRTEAKRRHGQLKRGASEENPFIIDRCPWCGAQMGPGNYGNISPKKKLKLIGYEIRDNTVVFRCPDSSCTFSRSMPIYVIDEDIYDHRPSMVIGTVDKFAMLTWRPEARALFGINRQGIRESRPPNLIIQDELHLISGPLGSMVGLYETCIEELCTDRRLEEAVAPKIVCSTATIRRYQEQVQALYGRNDVVLFPPPGLAADNSFFARYAKDEEGTLLPGRIYVGIHAPGLGSLQTVQVRTFTALLQGSMAFPEPERDPWWTLMAFFNSLRELGTSLSLLQSDIPDRLKVLMNREGFGYKRLRTPWNILELTGRMLNHEIPKSIAKLQTPSTSTDPRPVDVCLASSIMEVGIDITRLSLIAIVGQPKSTSQYIQVTGRVGRNWWERPGLVTTILSPTKPRDRSHYEKFKTYHQRLYAQVEPTSVTPFSPPALDRALHAVMVAYVRQYGNEENASKPFPYPDDLISELHSLLLPRITDAAPEEVENFERIFQKRATQWENWQRTRWDGVIQDGDVPLLWEAGSYINSEYARLCWKTMKSMRNVDAECEAEITNLYLEENQTHA